MNTQVRRCLTRLAALGLLVSPALAAKSVQQAPKSSNLLISVSEARGAGGRIVGFDVSFHNTSNERLYFSAKACGTSYRVSAGDKVYIYPSDADKEQLNCAAIARFDSIPARGTLKGGRIVVPQRLSSSLKAVSNVYVAKITIPVSFYGKGIQNYVIILKP